MSGPRLAPLLLAMLLIGVGCRASEPEPEPPPAETLDTPAPASFHSPYVLLMSTESAPFHRISMKDVGMSIAPAQRDRTYQRVATSLSTALADDDELPMSSQVLYSQPSDAPAEPLSCGVEEVYVDLWTPSGHERWGYSLWSGCSEDDEFAHREIERLGPDDVDSLTKSIAHALRRAVETRCFTRNC